jgi:hypothetical protein
MLDSEAMVLFSLYTNRIEVVKISQREKINENLISSINVTNVNIYDDEAPPPKTTEFLSGRAS